MKHIFILEDAKPMHFLYKQYLDSDLIKTHFFVNAQEFFDKLSTLQPDLIISDYRLEDNITAYDILSSVRANFKEIPFIMVSGNAQEEIIIKLHKLNCLRYFIKPIDYNDLQQEVHSILNINPNKEANKKSNNYEEELNRILNKNRKKGIVIEDVKLMFNMYNMYLQENYEMTHVKSLSDLKTVSNKHEVELIIMDYALNTDVDFDQILNYVKKFYKEAKRILISGYSTEYDLFSKYSEDFVAIYNKPLDSYSKLVTKINEIFELNDYKKSLSQIN